ncbi:peptidase S15 domain protein [Ralstonia insidiosa]|uniref:Peptidase S15 domain protein n=1 Tax=Ralstonia insidiosa TaxID=190721 RepID=A0AAC9FPI5_9RALS|nr:peptidase S15 domain protein [Ralstonia insidiosa]
MFTTSALISKGHKLRVAVGASNLPQGVLTFYSDATQPSKVVLPVVPASALQ